jgi:hypothetical protein
MAKRISPELRAAALADLHAGDQPAIVAERHGIDAATVRSWKARFVATDIATDATPIATRQHPAIERQKVEIGSAVLDLLRAKLDASRAIAEAVKDPAWLKRQRANDLATLGEWLDGTALAIGDRLAGGDTDNSI